MLAKIGFGFSNRSMLILGGLWVLCLIIAIMTPSSWDVAWRIEIGQRMLRGAILYKDIVEVNPPLWFWSVLPSNFLANKLEIAPYAMLCVTSFTMASFGIWILNQCIKPLMAANERFWLVLASLLALFLIPLSETGQREIPLLLAGLLWACLTFRRAQATPCPPMLSMVIACFCAYGFALKHYYLLVPIGLEIWLIFALKRAWRPFRTETISLVVLGFVYATAALKLAPHFMTDMVPLIVTAYGEVIGSTSTSVYSHMLGVTFNCLVLIVPFYLARHAIASSVFAQILLVLLILQIAIVLLQAKGFANHFLAGKGTAIVLWSYVCALAATTNFERTINPRVILGVLTLCWVGAPTMAAAMQAKMLAEPIIQPANSVGLVLQTIEREPKDARIFVLSASPGPAFFIQWMENRPHFSRYYSMWMVSGLLNAQRDPNQSAKATALLDRYKKATIADILCASPSLILADTLSSDQIEKNGQKPESISQMAVLTTDNSFNTWLDAHYIKNYAQFGVAIWRSRPNIQVTPTNCAEFQQNIP